MKYIKLAIRIPIMSLYIVPVMCLSLLALPFVIVYSIINWAFTEDV